MTVLRTIIHFYKCSNSVSLYLYSLDNYVDNHRSLPSDIIHTYNYGPVARVASVGF